MKNNSSFAKLFRLLKPELRPRLGALVLMTLLASVAAFGVKAPILLLEPLWNRVLFPVQAAVPLEPAEPETGEGQVFESFFQDVQRLIVDGVFGTQDTLPPNEQRMAVLWTVFALILFFAVVAALAEYGFTWLSRWVSLRLVVDLRGRIAQHLMGLSMRYHGERLFGDLLSRVSNDVSSTLAAVQLTVRDLTMQPLLAVFSIGVAVWAAPVPALAVCLFLPVVALPISVLGRKVRRRMSKSLARLGASLEVLTEMFRGMRTVKAFRAETRELERYRVVNEEYLRTSMKMVRSRAAIQAMTLLLSHIGFAGMLLLIGWFTLNRGLFTDGGRMMAFVLSISLAFTHIRRITRAVTVVQESAGAGDRIQALLDEPGDIQERADALPIDSIGSGIAFEGVNMRYAGAENEALADVTIRVRPGETLALVGPSGAGKSTFVDLVARFIDPTAGQVTVDGKDMRDLSMDHWTRLFAMVGQVPFLFHTTVRDNIRYGDPSASQEQVEEAARAANIHDFILGLPQGYGTVVGDDGSHLSGGQRQRITIARAILKGAPLLLLDEATSSLDSESEAVVQEALDRLMTDRTVIVIAHRLTTIRGADRIAVLEQGRLVEIGDHADLLAAGGTYSRLQPA